MNLRTWQRRYLPITKIRSPKTELEAARLSLRKWQGLRPEVIKKVRVTGLDLMDRYSGDDTCALCIFNDVKHKGCVNCILYKLDAGCTEFDDSPWREALSTDDPSKLIEALTLAVNVLEGKVEQHA